MGDLMSLFLSKSSKNRDLLNKGLEGDLSALALLRRRFEDYIFQIYFLSYIKKSITYKSFSFRKRKKDLSERETLTLNTYNESVNDEFINTISDQSVDLIELITPCSKNFDQYFSDQNLINTLNSLTERQQEVIKMLFVDDKSEIQVAKELGVSLQSINKVKNKAFEKIKNTLEEIYG